MTQTTAEAAASRRAGPRRWRWIALLTLGATLPLAAFALAVATIDPNDYKRDIAAAVQEATGRALSLDGPLRISRSLWPTIEITDAKLANLPGGSRPDMARVERIEARLSLPHLLWRQIEITSLTLIGPNILFEQVGGNPNWVFQAPGFAGTAPDPAATQPSSMGIRFRAVHVQNGMVTFRLPARTNVIGVRSLDFHRSEDRGPLDVSSVLVYGDNQPFRLAATATPTGTDSDPWQTRLAFGAYDTNATATGTMDLGGDYDLQLVGASGMLSKLNALYPAMRLPALRDLTLSTNVRNGPVRGALPVIGKTEARFASADLRDRIPGLTLGSVTVSLPNAGGMAAFAGEGVLTRQAFTAKGRIGVPEHPDGRNEVPFVLETEAQAPAGQRNAGDAAYGSVALTSKLTLDTLAFAGLDGSMKLRTPALARLRPVVSPALPALTGVTLDSQLTVAPNLAAVALRGATLGTDQGDIAGDATIGLGPNVAFKGTLRSKALDGEALLVALGVDGAPAAPDTAASGTILPERTIAWGLLRGPTVDLTAGIGALTFLGETWRDVQLAMTLDKGQLRVSRLSLAFSGGPLTASLTADATAVPVPLNVTLRAPALPLALVARLAEWHGNATGSLRVETTLRAEGSSTREIAASLDGPVSITLTNGSMSNGALIRLASAATKQLGIEVPPEGKTAINCFGLVGSFDRGVGQFTTVALDTTFLKLAGAGAVNLATEQMRFRLYPMARVTGSPVRVPVVLEGSFANPESRLDASGIEQLGFLFNGLLGGDRQRICADAGLLTPEQAR